MMHVSKLVPALIGLVLSWGAAGQEIRSGSITVADPWARASAGLARTGAAYMSVSNTGSAADRLVGASSPAADKVELHEHVQEGDVMRMRPVPSIELQPGASVTMQPGGLHVMLLGLKEPLREGQRVPATLVFQNAGPVALEFAVRGLSAPTPAHGHHHPPAAK